MTMIMININLYESTLGKQQLSYLIMGYESVSQVFQFDLYFWQAQRSWVLQFFWRGTVIGAINRGCDDPIVAKQMRVKGKDIVGTYATLTTSIGNA